MSSARRLSPAFVVAGANIILAVLAFAREAALGAALGTTYSADAFALSLYLSDVQANGILYGAIVSATIPVFSGYLVRGRGDDLRRTLNSVAGAGLAASGFLWAVNAFAARMLIGAVGSGFSVAGRRLAVEVFLLLLPVIPCYVLFGLLSANLQANSEFIAPAFGPVVLNVVFLAGAAAGLGRFGVAALGVSYSCGAVVMVLLQMGASRARGIIVRPTLDWGDPGLKSILAIMTPVILAQVLSQPGYLVERMIAGGLGEGGVSSLTYAYKVSQIPVWVFVAALATVAFPALAKSAYLDDTAALSGVLEKSAKMTLAVTLPSAAVFAIFARRVVALVFMRGAFGNASLESTSQALRGYAMTPVCQGFMYLLLRLCYAIRDMRTLIVCIPAGAIATVVADLVLAPRLGLMALGCGATIGLLCSVVLFGWRFRAILAHGIWWRLLKTAGHVSACCFIMILAMVLVEGCMGGRVEATTEVGRLLRSGVLFTAGFVAYLAACLLSGLEGLALFQSSPLAQEVSRSVPRE